MANGAIPNTSKTNKIMYKRLQTICQLLESRNQAAAIEETEAILFFQPSHEIEKLAELIKKAE